MDRRGFLQGLAAAFAAPVVAKLAPFAIEDPTVIFGAEIGRYENIRFITTAEYGNALQVFTRGLSVPELISKSKEILFADARKNLPTGTPFYILDGGEQDYGFVQNLAWYYSPRELSPERASQVITRAVA